MFSIIPSAVFYLSFYYGSVNVQFCVSFRCVADASVLSDSWQPVDCSPPGCAVHGILQGPMRARVSCPPSGHLPTQAPSLGLLCLPHWQAGSSTCTTWEVHDLFQILSHYRLKYIEHSSLSYTAGPCLFIIYISVYLLTQTPNLSLPSLPVW